MNSIDECDYDGGDCCSNPNRLVMVSVMITMMEEVVALMLEDPIDIPIRI